MIPDPAVKLPPPPALGRPEFLVDDEGRPTRVLLDIRAWRAIEEYLEDLADVAAFDAALADPDSAVKRPLEEVLARIERGDV
jgi:hypothetical protein